MILLRLLFFLVPFLWSIYVCSQPRHTTACGETCFESEVVSVQKISPTCTAYELRVSFTGECAHALSHFTVAVPCGSVEDLWNSEGWKQVVGTDPTTSLTGFKIDDIPSFGETSLTSFTVKFKVCQDDETCMPSCWQPVVAFKAATCVDYDTLTVNCQNLRASLQKKDASCFDAKDGSLSVVIEEGQPPFTYLWSNNSTAQSLEGVPAGNYSVVIHDASGAEVTLADLIGQPDKIVISGMTTPASCNGTANGSVDISVSGGGGGYLYLWDDGSESEDVESLSPGVHSVKVTDANGCTAAKTFVVGTSVNISISAVQVKPDCNESNGSIDVSVSNGTAPYTFAWSNGATTEDIQDVGSGLYTVTVTDGSGCSTKSSFFLRDNNTLTVAAISSPTGCTEDASGQLDLSVSGGTAPYTYLWSNGETSEDISGLESGYYTVTVTDVKGCTVSGGFTVSKKTIQVSRIIEEPSCHGSTDGSISVSAPTGGEAPYSYLWSNGETGMSLTDIGAGVYTVTVSDAAGCSRTLSVTLDAPDEIVVSSSVTNTACGAEGSFAIDLNVSGGTAPYAFAWSDGVTDEDRSNLQSGVYTVVITDANGCTSTKEINVESTGSSWSCLIDPPAAPPVCSSTDNTISTSVAGADSYLWTVVSTDGQWSMSSSDLPTAVYSAGGQNSSATFTLTIEKGGCTQTCSYTVTACSSDDQGGEDSGGDDGSGTPGDCSECFSSAASFIEETEGCRRYEFTVSTDGSCRHELSHWTIAIPCGVVSNYSNSEGWKMQYGQDPTTGLYGLKVDDIDGFGKRVSSFTVSFTLCDEDKCNLADWSPLVAYKAGLCVSKETVEPETPLSMISVYPNPFEESLKFEWHDTGEQAMLLIVDQYGTILGRTTNVSRESEKSLMTFEAANLPRGIYYYRLTIGDRIYSGKISRK